MGVDSIPIRTFLETLEKWLHGLKSESFDEARFQANQLKAVGLMLTSDPEFKRLFLNHLDDCALNDSEHVLDCVQAFFHAITEASQPGRFRVKRP